MKLFILLSAFSTLLLSAEYCSLPKPHYVVGRLEIKAICSNYTISIIDSFLPYDTSLTVANWTDETTGKSYKNVFKLGNPCQFPDSIKQGDEFYFLIDNGKQKDCMVCMAYYPTPSKKINIKVVKKP